MTDPPPFRPGRPWRILLLILFAAAALRCHKLTYASTWFDERASIMSAAGHLADWGNVPLGKVIDPPDLTGVAHEGSWSAAWHTPDFHPPLYTVTLRIWRDLFGEGDAVARSLSVAASLAAIVCLFDLGRTLIGPGPALWACATMAVAYPQIQYAQEARDYALWLALGMGAAAAAARLAIAGPGWRRAIALNLCLLALPMTHFLAMGTVAALVIWCALWLRGQALRQALIAAAFGLPIIAILGGGIISQAVQSHHSADWMIESPVDHVSRTLRRVLQLPAEFLTAPGSENSSIASAMAVVYFLPLLLARRNRAILWCGLWLWCGVGLVFILDLARDTRALTYDRFTLAASPGLYLLLAGLPLRRGLQHLLPLLAVAGCLLTLRLGLPADQDATYKGQWRQLGDDVRRLSRAGDLIVLASPPHTFLADAPKLYEGVAYYCRPIPCPVLLLDHPPDAAAEQRLRQAARVWVVTPTTGAPASDFLPGWRVQPAGPNRRFAGLVWQARLQ